MQENTEYVCSRRWKANEGAKEHEITCDNTRRRNEGKKERKKKDDVVVVGGKRRDPEPDEKWRRLNNN